MEIRKEVNVWISFDEIVEKLEFNEQRILIRPIIGKLLEYYQGLHAGATTYEKEHRENGKKKLAAWQRKRKKALKGILDILFEILVQLDKLNKPLKAYHNDCMGCHTKVKA